jgi:hypothetical protein
VVNGLTSVPGLSDSGRLARSYVKQKPFCTASYEPCWWQNRCGRFVCQK